MFLGAGHEENDGFVGHSTKGLAGVFNHLLLAQNPKHLTDLRIGR